ncbi:MAG: hypothetical protein M1827_002075 [Pycnora praestabilis]|nr:MAG: hypothetical protein M1827_002075 [Pycnora praestabilis]
MVEKRQFEDSVSFSQQHVQKRRKDSSSVDSSEPRNNAKKGNVDVQRNLGTGALLASQRISRLATLVEEILCDSESINEHVKVAGNSIVKAAMDLKVALDQQKLPMPDHRVLESRPLKSVSTGPNSISGVGHLDALYDAAANDKRIPPLPPIRNASLSEAVFTHHGSLDATRSSTVGSSYERLEFLGDAYLELIASRLVYSRFPDLSAGRLSQKRELLIKNDTLAKFVKVYGLDRKVRMQKGLSDLKVKTWTKTLGDIFEAYVAAMILSDPENGFGTAEAWLIDLWVPKLHEAQDGDVQNKGNGKQELAKKVMGRNILISYIDEGQENIKKEGKIHFYVGVYLTGWGWQNQWLGSGKGLSKGEAGNQAAFEALENVPLIDNIAAAKKAHLDRENQQRKPEWLIA